MILRLYSTILHMFFCLKLHKFFISLNVQLLKVPSYNQSLSLFSKAFNEIITLIIYNNLQWAFKVLWMTQESKEIKFNYKSQYTLTFDQK